MPCPECAQLKRDNDTLRAALLRYSRKVQELVENPGFSDKHEKKHIMSPKQTKCKDCDGVGMVCGNQDCKKDHHRCKVCKGTGYNIPSQLKGKLR